MKPLKKIYLLLFITLTGFSVSAQQKESHFIKLIADGRTDSVILRWAPSSPLAWQMGNKFGYKIERFTLSEAGVIDKEANQKGITLNNTPVKPLPKDQWDRVFAMDSLAQVVHEAVYGENFKVAGPESGSGAFIENKQELDARFGFSLFVSDLSPVTAQAAGLRWVDKNVKPGNIYIYRVTVYNNQTQLSVMPGIINIAATEKFKMPVPEKLIAEGGNKAINLRWPVFLHKGIYSTYSIERSADNVNFSKVNPMPFVNASKEDDTEYAYFVDSIPKNNITYHYRITGISPFGEKGPASLSISGSGKEPLAGQVFITGIKKADDKKVYVAWNPDDSLDQKNVKGFIVERAANVSGPFIQLNEKPLNFLTRSFADEKPGLTSYYRIKVLGNTPGQQLYSLPHLFQQEDDLSPARPIDLTGNISERGLVTLNWTAGKEDDLLGYRVFRANNLNEEFIEISQKISPVPSFKDSINLNTLTSKICYKIIAVDHNYNTSEYSPALALIKPDKVSPVAPALLKYESKENGIELIFSPSVSNDVVLYTLYRTEAGNKLEAVIKVAKADTVLKELVVLDSKVSGGHSYSYRIQAEDQSKNVSSLITGNIYHINRAKALTTKPSVTVNREQHHIVVKWKAAEEGVVNYTLYRSKKGKPLLIYKTISGTEFLDSDVEINNTYSYKIQSNYASGTKSALSKEITVNY
jgi:uncharacterized protein